jgi:hypothetical protein
LIGIGEGDAGQSQLQRTQEGRRGRHDRHRDRRDGGHAGPSRRQALPAEFFVDGAHEETHGCDYLLADDIDMEPVPGYAAASWDKGYGDFVMKPDMTTLRRLPWLEGTALVLADVLDHHHHDVPHSPRAMLKAQAARLKKLKMRAYCASELEFYLFDESYEAIHAKRYHEPKTAGYYIEDYHILQTTKEEGVMRAIRKGLQGAGIPVENSKGEWGPGPGGDQRPLFRRARHGGQSRDPEERREGDRARAGQGRDLHVEVELRPRRAPRRTCTRRCGMRPARRRCSSRRRPSSRCRR